LEIAKSKKPVKAAGLLGKLWNDEHHMSKFKTFWHRKLHNFHRNKTKTKEKKGMSKIKEKWMDGIQMHWESWLLQADRREKGDWH